jgi:hypothetical protein
LLLFIRRVMYNMFGILRSVRSPDSKITVSYRDSDLVTVILNIYVNNLLIFGVSNNFQIVIDLFSGIFRSEFYDVWKMSVFSQMA